MNLPTQATDELRRLAQSIREEGHATKRISRQRALDSAIVEMRARYPEAFHTEASLWTRVFVHQPMGGGEIVPNVVPMRAFRRAAGRR